MNLMQLLAGLQGQQNPMQQASSPMGSAMFGQMPFFQLGEVEPPQPPTPQQPAPQAPMTSRPAPQNGPGAFGLTPNPTRHGTFQNNVGQQFMERPNFAQAAGQSKYMPARQHRDMYGK